MAIILLIPILGLQGTLKPVVDFFHHPLINYLLEVRIARRHFINPADLFASSDWRLKIPVWPK